MAIVFTGDWAKRLGVAFREAGYAVSHVSERNVENVKGGLLFLPLAAIENTSGELRERVKAFGIVAVDTGDHVGTDGVTLIREQTEPASVLEIVEKQIFSNRFHERYFIKLRAKVSTSGLSYQGHTIDISVGGAAIELPHRSALAEGDEVKLALDCDGGPKFECKGIVRWRRRLRRFFRKRLILGLQLNQAGRENEFETFIAESREFLAPLVSSNQSPFGSFGSFGGGGDLQQ